jgi:ribosomal protein S6
MFLIDSGTAAADWQKVLDDIQRVLDRAGAEVVSMKKWDDRRMAYEINRKARGTYILTYFNCDTDKIGGIERDVQLSELLIRVLILRTDQMKEKDLEKATPLEAIEKQQEAVEAAAAEKEAAKAAAEAAKAAEAAAEPAPVEETPEETTEEETA